jgi:hypothetical protein
MQAPDQPRSNGWEHDLERLLLSSSTRIVSRWLYAMARSGTGLAAPCGASMSTNA